MHGPRGGGGLEEGHALCLRVFWFGFFFPRNKFALATPQGCRRLLPLLRPWAHTSGCRLQSSFPCEKCKIFESQRLAHLVQKERAPESLGAPQLRRDSCLVTHLSRL